MAGKQEEKEEIMEKWEGKATARLKGVKPEQVWTLFLDDFCSFHKWLPTIDTCYQVEGINGQPGAVRYCSSTTTLSDANHHHHDDGGTAKTAVLWCHEKLVSVDAAGLLRSLSYQVLDNNLGIKSLVTTIKVSPAVSTDGDDDGSGCQIQWSFVADPMEGLMTYDGFSSYINFALQGMAENMEKALQKSPKIG
ncbi:OLC1v1029096C2 [Oldenlandia corymbosa var. corymbosa]|uniref:OLC1v1029096C2 n=1 Tax=Oldenlandia corymbosa var. corymbosa TaxID=529605 RepID=A0AAV1CDT7_OLDCO|nr:OLC1v1029096C2 [Oldenlandia corymbosa var. corymbosa]